MLSDLLRRLTAPAPQHLPETDARIALGALLVRVAIGFTVVGLLEMFHDVLVVENLQIPKEAFTEYLLLLVQTMGPALQEAGLAPMIKPDYLESREQAVQDLVGSATSEFSDRATTFLNETTSKLERELGGSGTAGDAYGNDYGDGY